MLTSELRAKFLDYFDKNDHEVVDSSPLIPANDDTLLFTNAGMVQFKDVFLGSEKRPYKRATTTQRCIRAGGKHNDLENVGYTLRHHTFFEMLGNFSFGDYFKEEAIKLAWNFLTNELNLDKERLWISVFREDDEAAEIWSSIIGIGPERIVRLDEEDNFWSMGETGPCGPCSEIYYDHGEQYEGTPPGSPGDEGDRFVEIWNLVFMQFNRDANGELTPLPKPSVDTGMGLERVAAVMQGVNSNYETDLFRNLIKASEEVIKSPGEASHKVIADHIRSVSFLIADGITPSNEGRGYVLRRIMRRGIRHGYKLGAKEPFLYSLVESLVREMESAFPMLASNQKQIEEIIHNEEKKFLETLDKGIEILEKEISNMDSKVIPGDVVFKLHDTFGFPFDLTADIAREQDLKLDEAGFNKCMEEQVKNSKSASKFKGTRLDLSSIDETKFLGYDRLNAEGKILGLWNDDLRVDSVSDDKEYFLALDQTPFYAESGGQVGDQGTFSCSSGSGQILDCIKQGKISLHTIKIDEGAVKLGDKLKLAVEPDKRAAAASNHSATHLMHAALKHVLGSHVEQKGSLVDASKLRFDFSHPKAVTKDEIKQIELLVNQHTLNNAEVKTELMKLDDAIASGAEAMFGEKYDDEVRVLSMSDGFSVELCGGTHVTRTGDIGMFIILSESSVSSGVRRIEAVTGSMAVELAFEIRSQLQVVQGILNVGASQVGSKVEDLVKENKSLKKGSKTSGKSKVDLKEIIHKINNFDLVLIEADTQNIQDLRQLVDSSKKGQSERCILILSHQDSKVVMVCGVTDDIQESLSANDVIQAIAKASNGKGGGRKDFAQGACTADNLEVFVNSIPDIVQSIA
ncbi:alanine--tRNA ligase [SAR86 cluster bacterium SAR86E]|uniref:Alanine--tRNA ligase n=1 Tax=SAR86 cluster bacterium SAR86E TaxID=1208365 RepID=K6H0R2_9GAMM|nr:alanine--tRNA ligase [SAR86 cluster bacterium SAR86E]